MTNHPGSVEPPRRPFSEGGVPSSSLLGDLFSRCVGFSLPLVYFLVTVSFYLRTYDSAQIKITLTQAGCSAVALFWGLQLIFQKRWPFEKKDFLLLSPFLAVLLSGIVSFAQSSFRAGSVDEFSRRVFYSLMAIIVIAEFRGMDRQRRLLRWMIAGFALTVFYGFVQYFDGRLFPPTLTKMGLDPFIWRQAFGLRVFSSFGNPNFYGNFLVIITPILILLYFRNGGSFFRPFGLLAALVPVVYLTDRLFANSFGGITARNETWVTAGLFAAVLTCFGLVWWKTRSALASGMLLFLGATFVNLYATETKGAWVGFVGAVVISALLAGFFLVGRKARKILVSLGVMSLGVALLGALVVGHYAKQRKQSVDFRVFTWIATWDMIRTQPWLGTGIGCFKWAYPAFRRPEIILLEGRSNTETDHAEDEYLEIMFDEGMIGFGIFLWMVISVSVMGLRFVDHYTRLGARPPPHLPYDDRVYKGLAYLGAWWAALIHWFFDVSIRFVSSGIYSLFLPALVTGLVRNDPMPEEQDGSSPLDRASRWVVVSLLAAFFLFPDEFGRPLIGYPGILYVMGCLVVLGEVLDFRLSITRNSFSRSSLLGGGILTFGSEIFSIKQLMSEGMTSMDVVRVFTTILFLSGWALSRRGDSSPRTPTGEKPDPASPSASQWALSLFVLTLWVGSARIWRGYFIGDISHNVAIFFSKQTVWAKGPEFDEKANAPQIPPEMKEEYKLVGGALEHYDRTFRLNPAFPMSMYFVGNVYSDWGTNLYESSKQADQNGHPGEAQSLRKQAVEKWDQSMEAYNKTKAFAPNYVQSHHQVGLLYVKRGEMETALGNKEKAEENWKLALKNFDLYHNLDPVFPANYYRQSYVHFNMGDMEMAEEAYQGALVYNSTNVVGRVYLDRLAETYSHLGRLLYIQAVNQHPGNTLIPVDSPLLKKSENYFLQSIDLTRQMGREKELAVEPCKNLASLYGRSGQNEKAAAVWNQVRQWAPEDSDVQKVFSTPPPPSR